MSEPSPAELQAQLEEALGSTLFTANNPTGIAVELVDGGFRIYDDWVSDTFTTFDEALAHARKCAADETWARLKVKTKAENEAYRAMKRDVALWAKIRAEGEQQ